MELALPDVFDCPLAWSCPQVFKSCLGMRICERRFGYLQGVVFMQNFWNFKAIPRTKIILTSIQSRTHSDKIQVIPMERFSEVMKTFCFDFWWKIWSDIWLVTKGWNFNLRVNENRFSTKMWRTRSDIWLVTKGWNINLRVFENRFQSIHFICMNNDFVSHEKALPTDPDCSPLIRKGLIRHVM